MDKNRHEYGYLIAKAQEFERRCFAHLIQADEAKAIGKVSQANYFEMRARSAATVGQMFYDDAAAIAKHGHYVQ